jgi:hypothetical protein
MISDEVMQRWITVDEACEALRRYGESLQPDEGDLAYDRQIIAPYLLTLGTRAEWRAAFAAGDPEGEADSL